MRPAVMLAAGLLASIAAYAVIGPGAGFAGAIASAVSADLRRHRLQQQAVRAWKRDQLREAARQNFERENARYGR